LKIYQPAIGMDARRSQPLKYSAQQHAMKLATMDAELRHRITAIDTAQFLPHGLTEPIGVDEFARADARGIQRGQQAERCEFFHGMRQYIDAEAKLAQSGRLFVDLDVDAKIVQGKSRRETANATSRDDDLQNFDARVTHVLYSAPEPADILPVPHRGRPLPLGDIPEAQF